MKTSKKMIRMGLYAIAGSMVSLSMGCMSVASYKASVNELEQMQRQSNTSNTSAIQAVQLDGGVGIGVDILNMEALKLNPLRQTLAAIGDALLIYGAYEFKEKYLSSSSDSSSKAITINLSESSGNSIVVTGDNSMNNEDKSDNSNNSVLNP